MNIVIGSGPAGVAAATALLDCGLEVTMLDSGGELEPEIQSRVDLLTRRPPEEWQSSEVSAIKGHLRYNSEGAPLKLAYGSDYVYRDVDRLQPVATRGVDAYRALAAGGLSALWGAAVLPYSDADFEGWPVSAADMSPYYADALSLTGLSGTHDALERIYPLHIEPTTHLPSSAQAQFVAARLSANAEELARDGIHAGAARLAISGDGAAGRTCVACGLCLYGCPYGLIYSAAATLRDRLLPSEGFRYVPGVLVRTISESTGHVTVGAVSRASGAPQRLEAERVYLAAGAIASTTILLESLHVRTPVVLRQSDHFLVPVLLRGFSGRTARERLHTLSQIFVELLEHSRSGHSVHLQLYTYNDYYPRMARERLGWLYPMLGPAVERVIDRVALFKGYLHSDDSARIRATLEPGSSMSTLRLDAEEPERGASTIRSVTALLRRRSRDTGAWPVPFAARRGLPGSGVHVGGAFPMRRSPGALESDVLGRPAGLTRVHVVDATAFPTMPAAPPTLTIMANAARIARLSQCGAQ